MNSIIASTEQNVKPQRAPRKPTIAGKNKQILLALIAVSEEAEIDLDSLLGVFGLTSETLKDATATNAALNANTNKYGDKFSELCGKRKPRKPKTEGEKKPRTRKPTEGEEKKVRKPRSDKGKIRAAEVPAEEEPVPVPEPAPVPDTVSTGISVAPKKRKTTQRKQPEIDS